MANAFHSIASQSASSTSSSNKPCYDVFINHRGKDVKSKLASTIYNMLDLMGVQVFLDQEELEVGDFFPRALEEAMNSASVHIAILSPSYAESPWCLEELRLMLQINATVIPVFYGVNPSDLRYVAKGKYAHAFVEYGRKGRYNLEKIEEWKEALSSVSYLTGCMLDADKWDEGKLLREIVESALHKMKKVPLQVATFPVGVDEAVKDFESKVASSMGTENVQIIGIVGMGGSGKTTLAKELYNKKCSSISRSSFLSNVRDAASKNTLLDLQKNLLQDLHIKHSPFHNIHQGMGILAKVLRSMAVLIVLDDVDGVNQMDALLPPKDNLGQGSFIIITTREVDVLRGISSIYPMKLLDPFNANKLFCRHAFLHPYSHLGFEHLAENYHNFKDLIKRFVEACKGLPLSLKVLGAMVNGRPKSYWESQLRKISRILPAEIGECLKLSYEALDREMQQMFLDVACFFIGQEKSLVIAIWDGSGWGGDVGWETLVNKCLLVLNGKDCIEMHDHLRDLGRGIAEDFSSSRLWNLHQISNHGGRTQIRGIVFDGMSRRSTLEPYMENIRPSLRALQLLAVRGNDFREEFVALSRYIIWLRLRCFDGTNLPSFLSLADLAVLELYDATNLQELWKDNVQPPLQLRVLIIRILRRTSFRGFPRSIGRLTHLKKIVLNGNDGEMRSLPEEFCCLESLEFFELSGFPVLSSLPDHFGRLTNLRSLYLWKVQLTALPDSFGQLTNLQNLKLWRVQLTALPNTFGKLTNLRSLYLSEVQLTALPESFGKLTNLQSIYLMQVQLTALPESFGRLANLRSLYLSVVQLTALPDSFGELTNLQSLYLMQQLTALLDSFGKLASLQSLNLMHVQLTALPDSFCKLTNLRSLYLVQASAQVQLKALPDSFGNLTNLESLDLVQVQLTALPDSFGKLRNLRSLNLSGVPLTALPESFSQLKLLQILQISDCTSLFFSSDMSHVLEFMTDLQIISILNCPQLEEFPHLRTQSCLKQLELRSMGLREIPNDIRQLSKLETLVIGTQNLTSLPESLGELSSLTSLTVVNCQMLEYLPQTLVRLSNLKSSQIFSTPVVELGLGVGSPSGCNLKSLTLLDLSNTLVRQISISDDCCPNLLFLELSRNDDLTEIETLPGKVSTLTVFRCPKMKCMSGIGGLLNLEILEIDGCPDLELLPCPTYMHSKGLRISIRGCPKAEKLFQDLGIEFH